MSLEIDTLYQRFLSGECSPEEVERLLDHFQRSEGHADLKRLIEAELDRPIVVADLQADPQFDAAKTLQSLLEQIPANKAKLRKLSWLKYAAAAIVFLMTSFGLWWWMERHLEVNHVQEQVFEDILPGTHRAQLTFADGRRVALDGTKEGITMGASSIAYADGSSFLDIDTDRDLASQIMTLTTPNGGTYQVTLPDGSKVWLNAASALRYPSRFEGTERRVELVGEGYFSVERTSGSTPFIVVTNGQSVEVLGTEFNISAYPDETDIKTTLVEGRVQVGTDRQHTIMLMPSEQSVFSSDGKISKTQVDVQQFTAWRKGKFSFDNKTFGQVMAELGRWYDLDIVYEGAVPNKTFYGGAYRNSKLSVVMELLYSADVSYRLEGRRLIIENVKRKESLNP